ncbi:hypothetical protein LCGC14_1472940 [marine sediment metagenome]|uniref:Uncharacterized protein n=1 Tax=marine sediment metagenome TaxID=412755 RepID=A0A0F9JXR3_9ZZZZ
MKNVRVRVRLWTCTGLCDYGIYEGTKRLMRNALRKTGWRGDVWASKACAIKAAKAMAKRIGIKYDPKIIKMHGC